MLFITNPVTRNTRMTSKSVTFWKTHKGNWGKDAPSPLDLSDFSDAEGKIAWFLVPEVSILSAEVFDRWELILEEDLCSKNTGEILIAYDANSFFNSLSLLWLGECHFNNSPASIDL
jgi:hypothetical protein